MAAILPTSLSLCGQICENVFEIRNGRAIKIFVRSATWQLMVLRLWLGVMVSKGTLLNHYNDVIMTTIVSQITSVMVVYSTVYWDADQRKHRSSASLAAQRASYAGNVSIWWRHHAISLGDISASYQSNQHFTEHNVSCNLTQTQSWFFNLNVCDHHTGVCLWT